MSLLIKGVTTSPFPFAPNKAFLASSSSSKPNPRKRKQNPISTSVSALKLKSKKAKPNTKASNKTISNNAVQDEVVIDEAAEDADDEWDSTEDEEGVGDDRADTHSSWYRFVASKITAGVSSVYLGIFGKEMGK